MHEYSSIIYEVVHNPQYTYHKLIVDGKCPFDEFLSNIERNKNDLRYFKSIINLMDNLTDANMLPKTKFRHIETRQRSDIFEFKKENVRVYVLKQKPDIFIILGGTNKGKQGKDIDRVKSLVSDFPK